MIYRTFVGVAAFFLLAAAVVKAQNTFTVTKYKSEGCFSAQPAATAVSGTCTSFSLDSLSGYVRAFMAPNSTSNYQYFVYTDSACTNLFTASAGRCNTCNGDKTIVTCPTAYATTATNPAWPTVADGFIQLTECYDASCSGSTCAVSAIKSGSCIAQSTSTVSTSTQAIAATCSNTDGFNVGFFYDTSCKSTAASNNEKVLTCASKSASTGSMYTAYRKYDCATANVGSTTITAPRGFITTSYNTTGNTCSGSPMSITSIGNGLCLSDSDGSSSKITCSGSSGTVVSYSDNKCTNQVSSVSGTITGSCDKGNVISCNGASSLVTSTVSMIIIAAAAAMQRLF